MAFIDTLEKTYAKQLRDNLDITRQKYSALMNLLSDDDWEKYLKALEEKNHALSDSVLQHKIDAYIATQAAAWRADIEAQGYVTLSDLEAFWTYRSNGNG